MSSVYASGPQTTGKVILITNYGNIDLELYTKEAPRACRNFIQLCMEGYYDKSFFFRIIKGFMIQTGDPTNTGKGGESIWGKDFMDEFHSRLRFNQRGMVAMANKNLPNTNGSQFFITLDKCSWLDKKHTIFGKVAGATFYNALTISELPTKDEYPISDTIPMIVRVDVILNPFIDIVPRTLKKKEKEISYKEIVDKSLVEFKKTEKLKNNQLLSFDDEGDELELGVAVGEKNINEENKIKREFKIRPVHELIKNDKKLLNVPVIDCTNAYSNIIQENENSKIKNLKEKIRNLNKNEINNSNSGSSSSISDSESESDDKEINLKKDLELSLLEDTDRKNEILQLKKEIVKIKKRIENPNSEDSEKEEEPKIESVLKKHQSKFLHLKKGRSDTKKKIETLNKFREKLKINKNNSNSWMSNKLKFHVDSQKAYSINEIKEKQKKNFDFDPTFK